MLQRAASPLILYTTTYGMEAKLEAKLWKTLALRIPNDPRGEHNERCERFPSRVIDVDEV
jgi:hypothetical protein